MRISKKNHSEHEICVLIFPQNLPETFVILKKIQRETAVNLLGIYAQYSLVMSQFNRPKFLNTFSEN